MKQIIVKSITVEGVRTVSRSVKKVVKEEIVDKKFALNFTKSQTATGTFKTSVNLIRVPRTAEDRQRGILHKTASIRNRLVGDVPSLTKQIHSLKPTVSKSVKTVGKALLKAENIALLTTDIINPTKKIQFTITRKPPINGKSQGYTVDVNHVKRNGRHERGIIHNAVAHRKDFGSHFKGDIFSLTKTLNAVKPKSVKGIAALSAAKGTYSFIKTSTKLTVETAENAAMGAENVALLVKDKAVQQLDNKFRAETSASGDTGKAFIKTTGLLVKGANGIRRSAIARKNYKHEKGLLKKYKQERKKAFEKIYDTQTFRSSFPRIEVYNRSDKIQLNQSKRDIKIQKKKAKIGSSVQKQQLKQKQKSHKALSKQVHRNNLMIKMQLDRERLQKNIVRKEKPVPPGVHAVKSAVSSGWNKAVNADSSNDVIKAIDKSAALLKSSARTASKVQHISSQAQLKLYNKSILSEEKSAFKKKNPAFKQKKKNQSLSSALQKKWKKWKNPNAKNPYTGVGDFVKDIGKTLITFGRDSIKSAAMYLLAAVLPICFSVVCLLLVLSMIIGIFNNIGGVYMGYNAKDKDLTEAVEYYTTLANNRNNSVIKCGDKSSWRTGLNALGINAYSLLDFPENPTVFKYGRDETNLQYDAGGYDFDSYVLWSFLCAYNYDFEASKKAKDEKKKYTPKYWTCNTQTRNAIKQLFDTEYEFHYNYVKAQYKERDWYVFEDNCFAWLTGADDAKVYKNSFSVNAIPDEVRPYLDSKNYLHFNDEWEILDYSDPNGKNKKTGWFILSEKITITDPSGYSFSGVYYYHSGEDPEKYYYKNMYDEERNKTSWYWKNPDDEYDQSNQIWFIVPKADTEQITGRTDVGLFKLYKKYDMVEDTTLYYVVSQNGTMKSNAEDILKSMSFSDERVKYFEALLGTEDEQYYGNHQLFSNPVYPKKNIHDLIDADLVCTYNKHNLREWNKVFNKNSHNGIDIICPKNTNVRSVIDGTITNIDTENQTVEITSEPDYDFWYDKKKNTIKITIGNIQLKSGLKKGDKVKVDDIIGKVTDKRKCADKDGFVTGKDYLHITVSVGKDSSSYTDIDPLLSFY